MPLGLQPTPSLQPATVNWAPDLAQRLVLICKNDVAPHPFSPLAEPDPQEMEQAREMLAQVMSHARETARSKPCGGAIRSLSAGTSSAESKAA